jgi:hypothetical protein
MHPSAPQAITIHRGTDSVSSKIALVTLEDIRRTCSSSIILILNRFSSHALAIAAQFYEVMFLRFVLPNILKNKFIV